MQFQSTSRSVLGQFQVIFRGVSDKVQKCFRAVSGQFQGSFRAVSGQFQGSFRAIAEQFEVVPRSRNQRASVTGFQEFKNGALLQNGIQNLHINHSFKLTYAGRFGGGEGSGLLVFLALLQRNRKRIATLPLLQSIARADCQSAPVNIKRHRRFGSIRTHFLA